MVILNMLGIPSSLTKKELKSTFDVTIKALEVTNTGHINLVFVDDEKMRILNKKYRRKDKPTDVLSFVYDDDCIGEILISQGYIKNNLRESVNVDVKKAFIHGILHIFGFDHEKSESERIKMEEKEREIYKLLT